MQGRTMNGRTITATCDTCGFTTSDLSLATNHSCDVQQQGGRCEDYPCCGHEAGDCNGLLYGSAESIKAGVHEAWRTGHGMCDHAEGLYECEDQGGDEEEDED
jgi:hypothetical protein